MCLYEIGSLESVPISQTNLIIRNRICFWVNKVANEWEEGGSRDSRGEERRRVIAVEPGLSPSHQPGTNQINGGLTWAVNIDEGSAPGIPNNY